MSKTVINAGFRAQERTHRLVIAVPQDPGGDSSPRYCRLSGPREETHRLVMPVLEPREETHRLVMPGTVEKRHNEAMTPPLSSC